MHSTNAKDIVAADMGEIAAALGEKAGAFGGARILLTGGAGFLGYYFIHFLLFANERLLKKPLELVCVDNFIRGIPPWLAGLKGRPGLTLVTADITKFDPRSIGSFDYIIHAASIASPTYYRKFPIETMDANIAGLRVLLDYCVDKKREGAPIRSFLFFSSSEIYGDPPPQFIPTAEDFRGFVSCTGPRACYDESKRFGETLCVNFHAVHGLPVKIARPFNNYGPGLSINDRRVIPDFCKNIINREDIVLLSDGNPTRTFCYVADAVAGYLLMLLSDCDGEAFNIGAEEPEISMASLARELIAVAERDFGISGIKLVAGKSAEKDYLVDNPDRRRPNIKKARRLLGFNPTTNLAEGLRRILGWYLSENAKGA